MVGTTLLGGILGGILAIPLTAALRVLMAHYVWRSDSTVEDRAVAPGVSGSRD
jgi:predicted PurR-regulated permease PerM